MIYQCWQYGCDWQGELGDTDISSWGDVTIYFCPKCGNFLEIEED